LDSLKRTGWFKDEGEIIQLALMDFARLNQYALPFERDEYAHASEPMTPAPKPVRVRPC
jgi:hypothetical protein